MVDINKLGTPGTFEVSKDEALGGATRVAYFYDANGNPAEKSKATHVNILILDKDGNRINEVYGVVNR